MRDDIKVIVLAGVGMLIYILVLTIITIYYLSYFNAKNASSSYTSIEKTTISLPHTIVAVGDIACDPASKYADGLNPSKCQDAKVASAIKKLNTEKVLLLGDNQYDNGSLDRYMQVFDKNWSQLHSIILPSPGNHEYLTTNASGYFDYFNGVNTVEGQAGNRNLGYYHTNIGEWSVYSLNSNCEKIGGCNEGSAQYSWLQNELNNDKSICKLAFWHHPIVSSSEHGVQPEETSRMLSIYDLLASNKTTLVLNGHDHVYERFAPQNNKGIASVDGIRQFTVGTGGKDLYKKVSSRPNSEFFDNTNFGFLELSLSTKKYDWKFNNTDSTAIDQGSGNCVE